MAISDLFVVAGAPGHDDGITVLRQRPDPNFITGHEVPVVHVRVPVDVGPVEHRMPHAAGLVFDLRQRLVAIHIDDIDEAILVLIALFGDQTPLQNFLCGPEKSARVIWM